MEQTLFHLFFRPLRVPHAKDLSVKGELARDIGVAGRNVPDPGYAGLTLDPIPLLREIDDDPLWVHDAVLRVWIFPGSALDTDTRIEVLEIALDIENALDLEPEVVQA